MVIYPKKLVLKNGDCKYFICGTNGFNASVTMEVCMAFARKDTIVVLKYTELATVFSKKGHVLAQV